MKDLVATAGEIAARLIERRQTIAVAESSTGGLISAALLAVPGASAYFLGSAVVYTRDARRILMDIPDEAMKGIRSASEPYAMSLVLRDAVRWLRATTNAGGYGSPRSQERRERASPLPERAHQLIAQRLDQVGQHGAVAGLHKGFHRHPRYQFDVAETRDFRRRHRNADRVVGLSGALVGGDVGRDPGNKTVQFRRRALVECRQPQQGFLTDLQFIDILRIDLGLDLEVIGLRNDHHDGVTGGDHPAAGMDRGLQHHAVLRRPAVDPLPLAIRRDL